MYIDRIPNIEIKILYGQKQQRMFCDVETNQMGEVNLNYLTLLIRQKYKIQAETHLYYFDHSHNLYSPINQETIFNIHFTSVLCQNIITFKYEQKLSDQLLANHPKIQQQVQSKRSRERIVQQAFILVQKWRYFYRESYYIQPTKKINLYQSAQLVGIPRKTLQDYYLILRMGKSLNFDFLKHRRQKIGVLRAFIREHGKKQLSSKQFDERTFFNELRFELSGNKNESIYSILDLQRNKRSKSNKSYSSSDEDMIFQN